MKLKVLYPAPETLRTFHRPDVALGWIVMLALMALSIWTFASGNAWEHWYFALPGLIYPIGFAFDRAIVGEFSLSEGTLRLRKSGLFGSSLFSSNKVVPITEISFLEMKRHVEMYGGDRFQIRVQLQNGEKLDLSRPDMWFDDCQKSAEEIGRFIGLSVGPRASA